MGINQIIMYIMAFGAALGGLDRLLGNRFGYGEKFEEGFRMLGPVGLSMAGIICLAPLLSTALGGLIRPLCALAGIDPSILGSILAIDMGGYLLAEELAEDPLLGHFFGIIMSATFGCTIVFCIPVGLGFLSEEDRPCFTRGILLGLSALPVTMVCGGVMLGIPLGLLLRNCLPILVISGLLAVGVVKKPDAMIRGFRGFGRLIQAAATLGLTLAAVSHLSGVTLLKGMPSLLSAMETVSAICIVMMGSMPLAELIQRLMKVPFRWIGEKTGLNSASTTALLLGLVTATPALAMVPQMNRRGKVVIPAALVSCVCVFGAHFAFTGNAAPEMVPAMLAAKLVGGLAGGGIAMLATRDLK